MSDERDHARKLAFTITQFWARLGAQVDVEVVRQPTRPADHTAGYIIRSNLKNGLPPKCNPQVFQYLSDPRSMDHV